MTPLHDLILFAAARQGRVVLVAVALLVGYLLGTASDPLACFLTLPPHLDGGMR